MHTKKEFIKHLIIKGARGMKFVTFFQETIERIGLLYETERKVLDIHKAINEMDGESALPTSLIDCIELGKEFIDKVTDLTNWVIENNREELFYHLEDIKLAAPIPRPKKNIFCVGKNYAAHAVEMGSEADIPTYPIIFSKTPTTVIGPNEEIPNHQNVTNELDYEGEIAVIIGKKGRGISRDEAYDYVFGYTLLNDVTARDLQRLHTQYLLGKSLDNCCPIGPWITHASVITDPSNLDIETKVNGEVRQTGNTGQFIFDIPEIIATISKGTTLEPGDIIATGTPSGVGSGYKPPKFLQPGDSVEICVPELGILVNKVSLS